MNIGVIFEIVEFVNVFVLGESIIDCSWGGCCLKVIICGGCRGGIVVCFFFDRFGDGI